MTAMIDTFTAEVGRAFADRHPEIQELVLERMDAPGDHTVRCDWTDDGRICVSVDGVEIGTVDIPAGSETS